MAGRAHVSRFKCPLATLAVSTMLIRPLNRPANSLVVVKALKPTLIATKDMLQLLALASAKALTPHRGPRTIRATWPNMLGPPMIPARTNSSTASYIPYPATRFVVGNYREH